jgi:cell division protein FtsB
MRKAVNILIICCIVLLQLNLWCGENCIPEVFQLKKTIQVERLEIDSLKQRNQQLVEQIKFIKANPDAVEEHARYKLGMIKQDESYYQVVMPVE